MQTLSLPGAGGAQQLWGVCGTEDRTQQGPLRSPSWDPGAPLSPLTVHREAERDVLGAQRVLSVAGELSFMLHLNPRQLQDPGV